MKRQYIPVPMTKRSPYNYKGKNLIDFMKAVINREPIRYATLMDATAKQNPILIGQAGYEDATYEERFV